MQGICNNRPDLDLTPENVRKDVDIFGVEGTFAGGVGNLSSLYKMFSIDTVVTDGALNRSVGASYIFETATHLNAIYTCVDNPAGNPNQIRPIVLRIDKTTGVFDKLPGEGLILSTSSTASINSIYINGDFIYINRSVFCSQRPPCYETKGCLQYQISTNTWTTILSQTCDNDGQCATTAYRNTTGTLMSSGPQTIGGKTVEFGGNVGIGYLPSRSLYRWISIS